MCRTEYFSMVPGTTKTVIYQCNRSVLYRLQCISCRRRRVDVSLRLRASTHSLTHAVTQSRSHAVMQQQQQQQRNATQRNATQRNGLVVDPPRVAVTLPRRHVAATLRRRCGLWLVTCGLWLVTVSCVIRPSSSLLARAEECRGSSVVASVASLS